MSFLKEECQISPEAPYIFMNISTSNKLPHVGSEVSQQLKHFVNGIMFTYFFLGI